MQNRNFNIEILEPLLLMSASGIEADLAPSEGNDYLVATEVEGFLEGGGGDDILEGAGGSNLLNGGAGDDTLFSLKGDNVLIGGNGNDVAVYTGDSSDYEVEDQGFGIYAVKSGDRTDFLTEVETLRFDDGTFNVGELAAKPAVNQPIDVLPVEPAELAPELVVEVDPNPSPIEPVDAVADQPDAVLADAPAELAPEPVFESVPDPDRAGFADQAPPEMTAVSAPLSIAAPPAELTIVESPAIDGEVVDGDAGDNVIEGTDKNDLLSGAGGDDTIVGNGGNDFIDGGDGNDAIFGDNGSGSDKVFTGETVRESFEWDLAGIGNDQEMNSFTQNTGNVDVTFTVLQQTGSAETEYSDDRQKVHSIDADGNPVDANSSMDSELKGKGNEADYSLSFSNAVQDVSFRINDIDGDGVVKVTAYDADNNPIEVKLSGGSKLTLSDTDNVAGNDTADSKGGYQEDNDPAHSVLVDIAGPVSRIVIEHDQDGHQNSGINVTDIYYDAPVFAVDNTAAIGGNDVIEGGAGDDVIYGDHGIASTLAGETVRESLEWDRAGAGNEQTLNSFTQNTGNVDVTFTVLQETGSAETEYSNDQQKVHGIDSDNTPVDAYSSLDSELKGKGNEADYALSFSNEVQDVSFRINDIDGDGVVKVTAYDADNTAISVNLSGGSKLTLSDTDNVAGNDTADSNGGYLEDNNPAYSVLVDIAGPVSRIVIEHDQDGHKNSGINITDVYFDAPVAGSSNSAGTAGNDIINGGAGNDIIYGDNGIGATGGATLSTTGSNLIQNGSFEDTTGTKATGYGFVGEGAISGWTDANGSDIDLHNDGRLNIQATDGNNWLDLDASPANNVVGQDVNGVVEGETYRLSFDLGDAATHVDNTSKDNTVTVLWGGVEVATINPADGKMEGYQFDLVGGAGDGSDRLEFQGGSKADYIGASVDNVQLLATEPVEAADGGDDILTGGEGADKIYGQGGSDTIIGGNAGDFVDGGTAGTDFDVLDMRGEGPFQIVNETIDADGDSTSGTIEFLDDLGNVTGSLGFTEIEEIRVDAVNADPNANDDVGTTAEDTEVQVNLIDNDTDANGDNLIVTDATVPADQGTLVNNGDGTVTFIPKPDFNGEATISYTIADGNGGEDSAVHVVTVTPVDDAPLTVDDFATTPADTPVTIDVLDNDTDADGQLLTVAGAFVPADQGTVEVVNDELVFTPAPGFSGDATITYTAADPDGNETPGTAIVSVEVAPNEGPIAGDDAAITPYGTDVYGTVANNDSDPDGDTLSYSLTSDVDNGTLSLNNLGTYSYSPNEGFVGQDSFTYEVSDGNGGSATATVTITVEPELVVDPGPAPNEGPIALDDAGITTQDVPAYGSVGGNDSDPNGDTLTYSLADGPSNGQVTLGTDGGYEYVPEADFVGEDTFTYVVDDGNGGTDTATVTIKVEPAVVVDPGPIDPGPVDPGPVDPGPAPNEGPIAVDDAGMTTQDVPAYGSVGGNDSDPNGDTLTYSLVSAPPNGQVMLYADGSYDYSPNADFVGQDTFSYQVDDGNGGTDTATVTITVDPAPVVDPGPVDPGPVDPGPAPNEGPIAVDDNVNTVENNKAYGSAQDNDSDPNGDALTYSLLTAPENGRVTLYADGSYEYSPAEGFVGQDSFTYLVGDGKGGTDEANVTVTVEAAPVDPGPVDPGPVDPGPAPNEGPIAVDDEGTTTAGEPAYGSVGGNDSDPNGDTLTYSLMTAPANGQVMLYADGGYEYLPNDGFVGQDSFTYLVGDGNGGTDTATVTMTVEEAAVVEPPPVDPGPTNQNPDAIKDYNTTDIDTVVTGRVLCNDVDSDGDALSATLETPPQNGTATVKPDGSYTYTPNPGFSGTDTFVYEVSDGNGGTDTAEVSIEVGDCSGGTPVNTGPDAVDDSNTTYADAPVSGTVAGNDSDPDGDSLKYWVDQGPSNGSLTFSEDGSYTYTPDPGYTGQDSFTYEADDSNGGSDIATVFITVDSAPNSGPDAVEDFNSTTYNTAVSGKVLCNDTDPDNDALAVTMNTEPGNGSVTVTPGGSYTYTPNAGFSGQDTFTYTITDGNGGTDTATVTIEVGEPLVGGESTVRNTTDATDDNYTTDFDTEVSGNVLTNDVDPDGDTLTATEMTDVRTSDGGTVSLFADGSFNYTPADGFTGVDTFVYESSDGNGNVATATVKITVNEAPVVAVDDGYTGETNDTISGNVVLNDVGVDSDVSVQIVDGPANGTLTLNSDGTFTYLANDGFSGEDTFRYTLVDGANTSEANVRLVIAEVQYDTTYVGSGQDGLIWGDPHFRGDDGGFYDVTGEADKVYNLLSDSNMQLNAKFIYWQGEVVDGTVIGELGLTLGNDKLFVDLNGANINGTDLAVGQTAMGSGTVDYDGTVTTIDTGDYLLTLTRQDGLFAVRIKVIDPFSDLVAPHGLWGQTVDSDIAARNGDFYKDNYQYGLQGGGALDKVDADGNIVRTERGDMSSFELYETADIFSTEALQSEGDEFFRFNARQGKGLNRI